MIKVWADVAWNDYCNFFKKKVTAPAPWAAAEPETAGKDMCPLPVLCGSQAAD